MALDFVLPRGPQQDDESLGSFVRRRFGREVLERVAQPLIGGIYTADPDRLSLAATMPRFLQMEREHRSVIAAMWKASRNRPQEAKSASGARWSLFVTLRSGMQTLIDTLTARLSLGQIRQHCAVSQIERTNGQWQVTCNDGSKLSADGVILSTPTFQTAPIVRMLDPQLAEYLATIRYSSAATVNLAFRREQIPHPLNGFGFVVPHVENRKIIACSFSSVKYAGRAPEGHALLRTFVGGSLQEEFFNLDDIQMEQAVRQELATLLSIHATPLFVHIARYPHSMPQYRVGHLRLVDTIEKLVAQHFGFALAGNAYRGVGIADCVRSGEAAAESVLNQVTQIPPR
jgi:oxygen-dependent protoporphyrinogen oxidase